MKPDSAARSPWSWVPSLYLAQGLPYTAVMTVAVIMYKRLGLDNTQISLYTSWLMLPWVIKPLWSPIVDALRTKRWWTLAMQAGLAAAFASVAFSLHAGAWVSWSLAAFMFTAFLSATHDIASDGFYMLGLSEGQQSMFVGIRSTFYRIAMIAGQGGLVWVAGSIEARSGNIPLAWSIIFVFLSALFLIFTAYHNWAMPRPAADREDKAASLKSVDESISASLASFFCKNGVWLAIVFILLYRFPEAMLVKLISPFLLDMGLNTGQVGIAYGTIGVIGLLGGGIAGGFIAARWGLRKVIMPLAWAMSLSCLAFVYLSFASEPPLWTAYACAFVEQAGYGLGTTAFMLYFIYFSEGPDCTTHYALCTGIMALGMMLPGMAAGALQQAVGYRAFFIIATACCALTILAAMLVKRGIPEQFGRKKN